MIDKAHKLQTSETRCLTPNQRYYLLWVGNDQALAEKESTGMVTKVSVTVCGGQFLSAQTCTKNGSGFTKGMAFHLTQFCFFSSGEH
jgi:hypothetical protein